MDFDVDQLLAIMEKIIELTQSSGGSDFVQEAPCGGRRFEDNAMIFYEKDRKFCVVIIIGQIMSHPLSMIWN